MQRRPVIGIPTQTQEATPEGLPRCWIMGHSYVKALTAAGALPWIIPLIADEPETLRGIYEQLDGLFLAGGVDMDPATYGETASEYCGRIDPDRDAVELALARWALAEGKPILGVCRGVQVMNVAGGGTLYQDVKVQHPQAIRHDYFPYSGEFTRDLLIHEVQVERHTRLGRLLGQASFMVNSMHHQGIRDLAPGFVPGALAPDGLIESVEAPHSVFAVGVQWHPEEFVRRDAATDRLFAAFLHAASASTRQPGFSM